jgi:Nif-specific regulatory protein
MRDDVHRVREDSATRALAAIYETSKVLTAGLEPGPTLATVLNVLSDFVGLNHGAVALRVASQPGPSGEFTGQGKGRFAINYVIAASTRSGAANRPDDRLIPGAIAASVFETGMPVLIRNLEQERPEYASYFIEPGTTRHRVTLMAVPIRGARPEGSGAASPGFQTLGVLCAVRKWEIGASFPVDRDMQLLNMVATLIAQSLRFHDLLLRDRERLMRETHKLQKELDEARHKRKNKPKLTDIVGDSPAIQRVIRQIERVANTRAPILLRGESGTGKELFARAIHTLSPRASKAFIKVNCAALSETLLESELFGHEKGAFTGAAAQRKGRFELAHNGTLFLDEIGEISLSFQAKLLRVLQEGEFERVGGSETVKVDVRLITATNKNLEETVAKGEFRADLYFRICVVPVVLPALRDRPEDIPALAEAFVERFNKENGGNFSLTLEATDVLKSCYFPGNVRELENCVQRASAMARGPEIGARDLSCQHGECLSSQVWRIKSEGARPVGGLASAPVPLAGLGAPPVDPVCPVVKNAMAARRDGNGNGNGNGNGAVNGVCDAPNGASCSEINGCGVDAVNGAGSGHIAGDHMPGAQREQLLDAMERAGWVQAKAARLLGLTPRQIGYALKKHNIEMKRF